MVHYLGKTLKKAKQPIDKMVKVEAFEISPS